MLWEKKSLKFHDKRGYLYLRETVYERDKRSHKKKPKKLGDGSAYAQRGKYSKKKDIYCGKIVDVQVKKFLTFEEFITEKGFEDFLKFKLDVNFDELLGYFVDYLLYIYEIEKDTFENEKKAYSVASGYLCKPTIDFIRRFNPRGDFDREKEIERFAYRCIDAGVYDEEIIMALYSKLTDNISLMDDKNYDAPRKEEFEKYRDFIKDQYK